jgi:hypothetical protein
MSRSSRSPVSTKKNEQLRSIDSILENLGPKTDGKRKGASSPDHIFDMKQHWVQVLEQIKKCSPDQEEVRVSVDNCTNVLHQAGYVFTHIVHKRAPTHTPLLTQSPRRCCHTV